MNKLTLIFFTGLSFALSAQETMKTKLKPLVESYLKQDTMYHNCIISDVVITNISIIDEKEKNKSLFDFYRAYRLKQFDEISFIKGKADFIEQHCSDNKELYKKYVNEIKSTLSETVPLIDSLWIIEDRYKTATVTSPATEYYLVTFNFIYTLNGSKVTEKSHKVIFTPQLNIIHHDFLNR